MRNLMLVAFAAYGATLLADAGARQCRPVDRFLVFLAVRGHRPGGASRRG